MNFRKEKRSNETHQSLTDRFSRLFRKSKIKQLNLLNAGQLQSMRMQQGASALQSELLQQVLISNMQQRNQQISELNSYTQTLRYVQTEKTGTGNVGAALMTYEPK